MGSRLLVAATLLAGCGTEGPFTIVTIDTRPAVHDVTELLVTLENDGTSLEQRFVLTSQTFPATFSIEAPGRTGILNIGIDALDENGLLVGRGAGATTVESPTASVTIDSADFVVNTNFPDDQFPADDFDSNGFQIAATDDGDFTVAFRERCFQPEGCHMLARRFDVTGRPLDTALAAGINQFNVSTSVTISLTTPAVAAFGSTTIAAWDFAEPSPSTIDGIACRALDADGNALVDQVQVSVETLPNVVSVHPVGAAAFVITWEGSGLIIKSAVVNSQCAVNPAGVVQVSTVASALTPAVAANGDRIFTTWIVGGNVRGRIANGANSFLTADTQILAKTATESIQYVRVAPSGDGFVIVVRWVVDGANTGPSRIEAYRTNNAGVIQGPPTLVTTRTGSNFLSSQSFGVSHRRADGALLVVWHSCDEFGDLSGCGVFGRILRPNGVPVGEEFNLATTTENNQENPAATALPGGAFAATWMDESQKDPDKSGTSVRARVLYPPFDDARNVIGAVCTSTADCGTGLACGASSDGGSRCFATCTPPLCPGGGTCSAADGGNACLF